MGNQKQSSTTSSSKPRINGAKKGKQFERDISNALGHIFPNAERMLEYQASGNIGVDIKGTGCFKIQCKRNANYAPIGKIHEVRTEDPNDIAILVTKGNHLETMAVLPFEALVRMLEVMHGMSPLLVKPEDTATKAIENTSTHVEPYGNSVPPAIVEAIMSKPPVELVTKKKAKDFSIEEGVSIEVAERITASEIKRRVAGLVTKEEVENHRVESTGCTFLGLPLNTDSFLSEGEMCFEVKNNALHLVTFRDSIGSGNIEAFCQSRLNRFIKGGLIVTGVRCHSVLDLGISLERQAPLSYSVETTSPEEPEFDIDDLV